MRERDLRHSRSADFRSPIEQELGVVEENYIGDSQSDISIEECKDIQDTNGLDIEAFVASTGYFAGVQTNIKLPY